MNLPPSLAKGKLVLPTVDTCRHRQSIGQGSDRTFCSLLQTISGAENPSLTEVKSRDICQACCESFPPTIDRWNPVIASLLFELTQHVISEGGVAGCSTQVARQLQSRANQALEVEMPDSRRIVPARSTVQCCNLGERYESNDGDSQWKCHHPSHQATTLERCQACRDWTSIEPVSRLLPLRELIPAPIVNKTPAVRDWAVGVLTAPRRESTLEWCLDSLVRAGWDTPHLFVDGLVRIPEKYSQLPITWREQPVGAWPNYWLALAELVQSHVDADAYMLLQDDTVLFDRDNLREYLESVLWPGKRPGLVSLYCSQAYTVMEPGWHRLNQAWVWGALAIVFPRNLAREFIGDPSVLAHRWSGPYDGRSQVDVLIGKWAESRQVDFHYPCPSLSQHVGNHSSIWDDAANQGFRRATWFANDLETPFAQGATLSDFPEDIFPCRPEFRERYARDIETGRQRMSQRRVVICGLCRNVRHFLPRFAARTERLGEMFGDYRVVLIENDSTDATVEFLLDWQKTNERIHVISERRGIARYPQVRSGERAARMADYRNRYREYVLEHFTEFDNVVVTDTDLAGGWSYDGLANTFGQDNWDFVGSYGLLRVNGNLLQFDAWAFRAIGHPHPHANAEVNFMTFDRGEPLLPVMSCFGGLGVYRLAAIESAQYGFPDMEHAELHKQMREKGFERLFLNPSQIVLYSPE